MGWLIYGTNNYKLPVCLWELNLPFVDGLLPEKSISNSRKNTGIPGTFSLVARFGCCNHANLSLDTVSFV